MPIPIPGLGDVKEALSLIVKPWNAYRGYRFLVFGTKSVGKTTLWQHLETKKENESVSAEISPTLAPEQIGKFKLKEIKVAKLIRVRVLGLDVPGDPDLRDTWEQALYNMDAPPHGIIFMLDNAEDTNKPIPNEGYDKMRLKEHNKAFNHLRNLIMNKAEIMDSLQAFLILVNKRDSWGEKVQYGDILKAADLLDDMEKIQKDLETCRIRSQPCSALYGSNIKGNIEWMIKNFK